MSVDLNIPFEAVPKLVEHLRNIFKDEPDSMVHTVKLGKMKSRDIAVIILGRSEQERLTGILSSNFFSICVDESTDVSKNKSLAIVVRFFDPQTGTI